MKRDGHAFYLTRARRAERGRKTYFSEFRSPHDVASLLPPCRTDAPRRANKTLGLGRRGSWGNPSEALLSLGGHGRSTPRHGLNAWNGRGDTRSERRTSMGRPSWTLSEDHGRVGPSHPESRSLAV